MRPSRVALIALLAAGLVHHRSLAQIPNVGFEIWSGGNPTDWWTSNVIIAGIPLYVNVT